MNLVGNLIDVAHNPSFDVSDHEVAHNSYLEIQELSALLLAHNSSLELARQEVSALLLAHISSLGLARQEVRLLLSRIGGFRIRIISCCSMNSAKCKHRSLLVCIELSILPKRWLLCILPK